MNKIVNEKRTGSMLFCRLVRRTIVFVQTSDVRLRRCKLLVRTEHATICPWLVMSGTGSAMR